MSDNRPAFIFPAFTNDFADHTGQSLHGFNDLFAAFLDRAIGFADSRLSAFSFAGNTFAEDELRTQYLTYIYSCAAAAALRSQGITPRISAGYSMGIYAALQDAGAIGFESGLELIRLAYETLCTPSDAGQYDMGTIIGLDKKDVELLISHASLRAEITNRNASHSFVVSGYRPDIASLLELATKEGALNVRSLNVSIPYHASVLRERAGDFEHKISQMPIAPPGTTVISLIDQVLLISVDLIRKELFRNLFTPLNWHQTMQFMLADHIDRFVECGPAKGLAKNARFIEGNFKFYSLNTILKSQD